MNRALRRFVDRHRFTVAPYPRSLDLVAFLREEAKVPKNQAFITDPPDSLRLAKRSVVAAPALGFVFDRVTGQRPAQLWRADDDRICRPAMRT